MRRAKLLPLVALLSGLMAGCSTLESITPSFDSLNPFAKKGPKMAELTPIQASAELRQAWSYQIGKAGNAYSLSGRSRGCRLCGGC